MEEDEKMDDEYLKKGERRIEHIENEFPDYGRYGRTPKDVPPKQLSGTETLEEQEFPEFKEKRQNMVRDPVCGKMINPETAEHQTEYEGKEYTFCCQKCLDEFEDSPEEFT